MAGTNAAAVMAAGGGVLSNAITSVTVPSAVAVTNANSFWPSVQAGDVAVWVQNAVSAFSSTPAAGIPTGFTQIATDALTVGSIGSRVNAAYRICDGSESGAIVGSGSSGGGTSRQSSLHIFRPNVPASLVTIKNMQLQITDGNPSGQTIPAAAAQAPLLVIAAGATATSFSVESPALTKVTSGDAVTGYKIYTSAPADHSVDIIDDSVNFLLSFILELYGS